VAGATLALDTIPFPTNYTLLLVSLAMGGIISFYFSRQIDLPEIPALKPSGETGGGFASRWNLVKAHPNFFRFAGCHLILRFGLAGFAPLLPLLYVRTLEATDREIGVLVTLASVIPVFAYFGWARLAKRYRARTLLLATLLGVSLEPIFMAVGPSIYWAYAIAAVAAVFMAGFELAIFEALATSLPKSGSPLFAGIYHTTLNMAIFAGPLTLTFLSTVIGVRSALMTAAAICLVGLLCFFLFYKAEAATT
jgi:MFS family permease